MLIRTAYAGSGGQALRDEPVRGRAWRESWPARMLRARHAFGAAGLALILALSAAPAIAQEGENDPIEPANRAVFKFNRALDTVALEPMARGYRLVTPRLVRDGVENFLANLRTPVVLVNDLLQGEFKRGELTFGRFMLNTILGFGGLIDIGGWAGMPDRHSEDFGQTLAGYGVGEGPYLMLPLLGPSNPRDAVGRVVDLAFDPLTFLAPFPANGGRSGADAVSFRERNIENIDELERTSIDLYAATRTLTRQMRAQEIRNGAPAPIEDIYGNRSDD